MAQLGVAEAARALGSSRSAVRKAIVRGRLAAALVVDEWGQSVYRVDETEIERYRAEHRKPRRALP
jgi:hypothetical protein